MKQLAQRLILGLALVLVAAIPSSADVAVSGNGEILTLIRGTYGELFPDGEAAPAAASVLALDIAGPDGDARLLIPTTEDMGVEESPTLYNDSAVGMTYLLWSSRQNGVHPFLRLARWAGEWKETLDIEGSVFAEKFAPQLNVHHEIWTNDAGEPLERAVFSVLWWEHSADRIDKRLKILVLENGAFVGSSAVQTLASLVGEGSEPHELSSLDLQLRVLGTESGFYAGFVGGTTGRLEILSFSVLNLELSRLATLVEAAIRAYDPWGGESLQDLAIRTIREHGNRFHPAMLDALIDSVLELIAASGGDVDWVADKAMPHIIHQGARLKSGGLLGDALHVLTVAGNDSAVFARHHISVTPVTSWSAPEVGEDTRLFISKRGTAALVAWDDGDFVVYRETTSDGGWTGVSFLDLTKGIDRDTAYRILEERTLER